MIFCEFYGVYYHTMAEILKAAIDHPLCTNEIYDIVNKYAFRESILHIVPALEEERWQLLKMDGTTPLKNKPSMPLTTLEKQWLMAISHDPRIRLFCDQPISFPDVEPLFLPEDILIFDRYGDGDCYDDPVYQRNFRQILDALRKKYPLSISLRNRKGGFVHARVMPEYLEYSEKDDKFRLICSGDHFVQTINVGRILTCKPCDPIGSLGEEKDVPRKHCQVVFELVDQRKALERVLLHFAHFEKQVEKLDEQHYRVTLLYDKGDETEMVIRILSFGPMIRVVAPGHFVGLIKERLRNQKSCEL